MTAVDGQTVDAGADEDAVPSDASLQDGAVEDGTQPDASIPDAAGVLVGTDADIADAAVVVPETLVVEPLVSGNGVLDMIGFTMREGVNGIDVYAALKNDDTTTKACAPSVTLNLYDKSGQPLATWGGGLDTIHFYELADSGMLASCVGPGDVTMAAMTGMQPVGFTIDDVGTVVYSCSYFALDVAPVGGLTVSQLTSVVGDAGTTYAGTLTNGFDASVGAASVTVFAVTPAGRPVSVATSAGDSGVIAPGGSWDFQTGTVDVTAPGFVGYPNAEYSQ
ncbi:MAG: hypothetical protein FWD17_01790 [Polyangiaceae bacterium]|nr:hypothetical protein [Polyangiaceae bacterium]